MEIDSVRHKGLRRFVEKADTRGIDCRLVDRLTAMLVFLAEAGAADELRIPPNFGAHQLTGDRADTWSLTVTRNWRMTFRIDEAGAIADLDLEDYH